MSNISSSSQASQSGQTVVVKLGTSVLTGGTLKLDRAHLVSLVHQCAQLRQLGHRVIVVTSGAIAQRRWRPMLQQ